MRPVSSVAAVLFLLGLSCVDSGSRLLSVRRRCYEPALQWIQASNKLTRDAETRSGIQPMMHQAVSIRNVEQAHLPRLYEFQSDPESNRLAVTLPRSADGFRAHWENALRDPTVTAKAIFEGDDLAGCISCFQMDGVDSVGYWLGREFWGRGIASRALKLLLTEITTRPLHARVATSNVASVRVLQKCGFVVERVHLSPADERYPECEEALLILQSCSTAWTGPGGTAPFA